MLRPWYVETITAVPKDIVVAMDVSNSMDLSFATSGKTYLNLAKEAVQTLISTLNPEDRVILSFESHALDNTCSSIIKNVSFWG